MSDPNAIFSRLRFGALQLIPGTFVRRGCGTPKVYKHRRPHAMRRVAFWNCFSWVRRGDFEPRKDECSLNHLRSTDKVFMRSHRAAKLL